MARFAGAGLEVTDDDLGIPVFPASEHMVQVFLKMKPVRSSAMGPEPRDWGDVMAFSQCTGHAREFWERETLVAMSLSYCHELQAAKNPARVPPAGVEDEGDDG